MEITKLPDYEIVINDLGELIEVYQDGKPLSEMLPSITKAEFCADCEQTPNKIVFTCYGDAKISYIKE